MVGPGVSWPEFRVLVLPSGECCLDSCLDSCLDGIELFYSRFLAFAGFGVVVLCCRVSVARLLLDTGCRLLLDTGCVVADLLHCSGVLGVVAVEALGFTGPWAKSHSRSWPALGIDASV